MTTPSSPLAPPGDRRLLPPLRRARIVGTGLIGASIGLALRGRGVEVTLADPSPTSRALARDLGAGRLEAGNDAEPDLVIVAAPPDVAADVVLAELARWPSATVTDVVSVKDAILQRVIRCGADSSRYVGSHPMAGRERSGAIGATADLFAGRPWVIVPHEGSSATATADVELLASLVDAAAVRMPALEHDQAVAAVSHVPQIAASLVAAQLRELPFDSVGLAGQGVRDVTRIAASDPAMWTQILAGNAGAVAEVLETLSGDLTRVVEALRTLRDDESGEAAGARAVLAGVVADGNAGYARIPGKHGATPTTYAVVTVVIPDTPGALARLLHDIGEEQVNLEDLHIEHGLGSQVGIVEVSVLPAVADHLRTRLSEREWNVHE